MSDADGPDWKDKPTEGRWVMTSRVTREPSWLLTFYVGAVTVAEIFFVSRRPYLRMWHKEEGPFATVGNAMRRMHQLLKLPPEDALIPGD